MPDLEVSEGQLLVRVQSCGICGSDLHITQGSGYTVPPGTVLGHEFAGEVVDIPKGEKRFKNGDQVVATPISGCGRCGDCLSGNPAYCSKLRYVFGGYAEYALVNTHTAMPLPGTLSPADGALAEPLAVSLHGVAMAQMRPGSRVLVQGAGPIGLAALFWARRLGADHVDVVEKAPRRIEIARSMGAAKIFSPEEITATRDPQSRINPASLYDVVIECVGVAGLLSQSLSCLRTGGTIVSLGCCFLPDNLVPSMANQREARILFPQLYTMREFEWALDMLDKGAVEPRHMVTLTVGLDEMPSVFEGLRGNPTECKVIIDPWQ